ncbi:MULTISPECIES: PEP-CTERM sorting domain-containing protein [unclassified Coleofasciculus]|uniref:PEP-CTERM sorting domain-containing protein n=1 Tax=Cyanophyceae TaxID=3028117 RepID=UPI001686A8F5|nr:MULTISPECIES: PEP-CTERM sorting domain-containing protein [unclassified Coleofasciculus]MBD1840113.1 PEP-CTERM sorting domain-containing protein [Coleofasciculus sp. FACHB-501]MBD1895197.1 PEP-CTERM sorting domain-containing protein [Coleofasciculus sp. FACHB-129]MBD2538043.1 PEP-CTERM sorting domain-containing protein [Coleofasciculus sp. FACHB-SPT36]
MSLMRKVTGIVGGAALLTMGINSAPSEAALLDFSLRSFRKEISFTLDTSVTDQDSSPTAGFFPNAISDLKIDGSPVPYSDTANVNTRATTSAGFGGGIGPGEFSSLSFFFRGFDLNLPDPVPIPTSYFFVLWFDNFSLVNQLSSDPNDYALRIGYGREDTIGSLRTDIPPELLTVTLRQAPSPNPVPEPSAMAGLCVLGLSFLLKKTAQKSY